jgi:methylglyoxal reductase
MKYQKLGKNGPEVSVIALGCWGLGGGHVWSDEEPDVKQVSELLDAAKELGINYIDTAPVYGVGYSEEVLGKALQGRRKDFVLQTKVSLNWRGEGEFEYERDGKMVYKDHHASSIRRDVEGSLERLGTDYIDAIVVHRMSETVPVEETMGELMKLKQEGKIGTVLLSNSQPHHLDEYAEYGETAGVQEKFSILNPGQTAYFDTCRKHEALFQVYGSLEEGALTGPKFFERSFGNGDVRTANRWSTEPFRSAILKMYEALEPLTEKYHCSLANLFQAWTLKQYDNLNLLTGFRHVRTMRDTCKVFDVNLSEEDAAFMDQEAEKVRALGSPAKTYTK